ncbi:MAG: hypothetical protein KF709_02615 [Gemmatimonadaceae bacterium]|nr:hypothetical protein [Gemmatimonadaceae bacterium]
MTTGDAPATGPAPGLPLPQLRNATELLQREVLALGRAGEEELEDRRPAEDAGADAWFAHALWLAERKGSAPKVADDRSIEQLLHEALADHALPVELASGDTVHVHPKSLDTLFLLDALDLELQRVRREMHAVQDLLAEDGSPEASAVGVHMVGALLSARCVRLFAWIVTHPGPGTPFAETDADPQPPEWTAKLRGADLVALVVAHLQVNRHDLDLLSQAFPGDERPGSTRLPLAGFVGSYSSENGKSSRKLMCNVTIRSFLAGALARAQTVREGMAAARGSDA